MAWPLGAFLSIASLDCIIVGSLLFRGCIAQSATIFTSSRLFVSLEFIHSLLQLSSQVNAMKRGLMNLVVTILTIPPQTIYWIKRPNLLDNNPDSVCKADWVMWDIWRQEEYFALIDVDVSEFTVIDNLKKHVAFILVKPFGSLINVIISPLVWPSNNLGSFSLCSFQTYKSA